MLREKILEGAVSVYRKKGIKFTMDDLAKEISMSKKTIYTVFRDKKHLIYDLVNYVFDQIKESEAAVVNDDSLSTTEKLRRVLSLMPESFTGVDFPSLYDYKDKYLRIICRCKPQKRRNVTVCRPGQRLRGCSLSANFISFYVCLISSAL